MESYQSLYQRACERKGGAKSLEQLLSKPLSQAQLSQHKDDQWLEAFTFKIFQSGFYWSVVKAKWPGFQAVFWQFSVEKLLMMSPEMLEKASQDERIIRNFKKVQSIADNCFMIYDIQQEQGSFSEYIALWPEEQIVDLWLELKKKGTRLGGNTGPYALRMLGKDTFLLTKDVETWLRANEIIDGGLHSKKSLQAAQACFNELKRQSGRSLQELSQIIAYSVNDNIR